MAGLRLARAALDFRLPPVGTLRWVPYPRQCRAARPQCRPRHLLGTGVTVTVARLSDMRRSALSGYTRARLRSASALPIRSQLLRLGTCRAPCRRGRSRSRTRTRVLSRPSPARRSCVLALGSACFLCSALTASLNEALNHDSALVNSDLMEGIIESMTSAIIRVFAHSCSAAAQRSMKVKKSVPARVSASGAQNESSRDRTCQSESRSCCPIHAAACPFVLA